MTSVSAEKSDKESRAMERRQDNFYKQTIQENNDRLNAKIQNKDIRDEIKFIQAEMLAAYENEQNM